MAWELAANVDKFDAKFSSQRGFEFAAECLPTGPTGGPPKGELQCCGKFPQASVLDILTH